MARSFLDTNAISWAEVFTGQYTIASSSDTSCTVNKTINGIECSIAYVGSALLGDSPVINEVLVTNRQTGADLARIVRSWDETDPDITRSIEELQSGGFDAFAHLMNGETWCVQIGSDQGDIIIGVDSDTDTDNLNGRGGNDTLIGGTGAGGDWFSGDEGFDYVSYAAASTGLFVSFGGWPDQNTGEAYGDRFYGVEGLIGSAHDDHFIGDRFANHLLGGEGNDTLGGNEFPVIDPWDSGVDTLDGGSGIDTAEFLFDMADYDIVYAGNGYWSVSNQTFRRDAALITNIEFIKFADQVIAAPTATGPINGTSGADTLFGTSDADTIYGGGGNDTIYGSGGDDHIYGDADDDHLYGDAGADTLTGGEGIDTLDGGSGNDTYVLDALDGADIVVEAEDGGTDTVKSSMTYTLGANVENLTLTGNATHGTGNNLANIIIGNAENNFLDGAGGADTLEGGGGDDTYSVDDEDDVILEAEGAGLDSIRASASYVLAEGVGVELLIAATENTSINLTGNSFANALSGNAGDNRLDGGDGNDTIVGHQGDDTLIGGGGNDLLHGAEGIDSLVGGAGNDVYYADSDDVIVEGEDGGYDKQYASASFTLGGGQEIEEILAVDGALDLTGNSFAQILLGNAQDNVLDGNGGRDTLQGAGGNDIYYVDSDDEVIEDHSVGNDIVRARNSFTLQGGQVVEQLEAAQPTADLDLTGNEFAQILIGNAGANRLDGKGGVDTMQGLDGNDTYIVNGGDIVTEAEDGGTDTVISTINSTLRANVENLTLLGAAQQGVGNERDNVIIGNDEANFLFGDEGNDTLNGGAGVDNLDGGAGDDTYIVDSEDRISDEVMEGGTDTIISSASHTLREYFENLTLSGTAAINGTGNGSDNLITGNSAANVLDGNGGKDTLDGGDGDDTYYVYGHGETIEELLGKGTDTVVIRGSAFTLADNVDVEILRADEEEEVSDITGNNLGNRIYGNSRSNVINGGGDNDEVVFTGNRSDYTIERREDGSFILEDKRGAGGDGADTVLNVEIFTFKDGSVSAQNLMNPAPTGIRIDKDVVDENSGLGKVIGTFTADDAAGDSHSFALTDNAGGRFTIDANTGELKVADGVRLDYEQATSHSITVKVTDGAGASISRTLSITVRDVTDESATGNSAGDRILGGNGRDTFSGAAGDDTLDGAAGHDRLNGDAGNDWLTGGAGNDLLSAGDGNDRLIGGLGQDTLTGGRGRDMFVFDDKETGSSKSKADTITDFKGKEGDRIDLKLIDAETKKKGDQKFSFIGKEAFTKAGQVRYEKTKKETFVYLNTDNDKAAEAVIKLKGAIDLSKGWFVL